MINKFLFLGLFVFSLSGVALADIPDDPDPNTFSEASGKFPSPPGDSVTERSKEDTIRLIDGLIGSEETASQSGPKRSSKSSQ